MIISFLYISTTNTSHINWYSKVLKTLILLLQGITYLNQNSMTIPRLYHYTRQCDRLVCTSTFSSPCFPLFFFLFQPAIVDFVNCEQCICVLFTVPQITLFDNFFIKNGSHNTIYTFKNYFATVFTVLAKISSIQTHPMSPNISVLLSSSMYTP